MMRATVLTAFLALGFTAAHAAPHGDVAGDKVAAKALMQSGLKLFAANDYLGALAVFKTAYERFPSSKILLNIGTTLVKLDRKAEAANTYQRYLDSTDSDPAKRAEVMRVLKGLDKQVARLDISIIPADSEVQIDDSEWHRVADVTRYRVDTGTRTVLARREGFEPSTETVTVAAAETRSVSLTLIEEPPAAPTGSGGDRRDGAGGTDLHADVQPAKRSRLGAVVAARIDPGNQPSKPGVAALVGLTAEVVSRLHVQAAALLGPTSGGYVGASFDILRGKLRPVVTLGVPLLFSDGARVAVRGAAGVELEINNQLAVFAEAGVEYFLNPEQSSIRTLFIPAIGLTGRL
jgi:hypothetical protein